MLVEKWMTRDPLTISENDSLGLAIHRLKERGIRRLPVIDDGKLIGILTDRDVKSASPSKASSLDIWELHFLLEKLKVADVMTRGAITISPDTTIERAAQVMLEKKIGGVPVVDRGGRLVGILTQGDVFKALVEVTGVAQHKTRVSLLLPDQAGSIRQVADICRDNGGKILSILVSYAQVPQGMRELIMRVDSPNEPALKAALEAAFSGVVVQQD